jgi:hypothetical protein
MLPEEALDNRFSLHPGLAFSSLDHPFASEMIEPPTV